MKNLIFEHIYLEIILEESLTDISLIDKIMRLSEPFKTVLNNLRKAMLGAVGTTSEEERTAVNTKVNIWRDKLIKIYKERIGTIQLEEEMTMMDIMNILGNEYTILMGGINTGYASASV